MSNKDLLKLENEFRNEFRNERGKEKPKIELIKKSDFVKKVPEFLAKAHQSEEDQKSSGSHVEMNLLITPEEPHSKP